MTVRDEIKDILKVLESIKHTEPFTNEFHINNTCIVLIVIYSILFMYKEEIMKMDIIKKLLK